MIYFICKGMLHRYIVELVWIPQSAIVGIKFNAKISN